MTRIIVVHAQARNNVCRAHIDSSGVFFKMGSFGDDHWSQCYWCGYWTRGDIYIIDWIGEPLCNMCFDRHTDEDGGPYQPDAITRAENHVASIFRTKMLPDAAAKLVATFLHSWHEP